MPDTRPKCGECNGRGVDGWGGTCVLCGGQGREPFREWGKEDDEDDEPPERPLNEHAECTLAICPTPDACFEMCKLHRRKR